MFPEFRKYLLEIGFEECEPDDPIELILQWAWPDSGEDFEHQHYSICWMRHGGCEVNEVGCQSMLNVGDVHALMRIFNYADAPYKGGAALEFVYGKSSEGRE